MKSHEKYRFTLQWGAETAEKVQAGELLKNLGNRKSDFIVMAIADYIRLHPESFSTGNKPQIIIKPGFTQEQIETLIKTLIDERLANAKSIPRETGNSGSLHHVSKDDVDTMIAIWIYLHNVIYTGSPIISWEGLFCFIKYNVNYFCK